MLAPRSLSCKFAGSEIDLAVRPNPPPLPPPLRPLRPRRRRLTASSPRYLSDRQSTESREERRPQSHLVPSFHASELVDIFDSGGIIVGSVNILKTIE